MNLDRFSADAITHTYEPVASGPDYIAVTKDWVKRLEEHSPRSMMGEVGWPAVGNRHWNSKAAEEFFSQTKFVEPPEVPADDTVHKTKVTITSPALLGTLTLTLTKGSGHIRGRCERQEMVST